MANTKQYRPLSPRVRSRLMMEIFKGPASQVYVDDLLAREEEYGKTRTSFVHLFYDHHYEKDAGPESLIQKVLDLHRELMDNPEIVAHIPKERIVYIEQMVDEIVKAKRVDKLDQNDISKFVQLSIAGREYFECRGYNPDEFVDECLVAFGIVVSGNFDAYSKTINYECT